MMTIIPKVKRLLCVCMSVALSRCSVSTVGFECGEFRDEGGEAE